MGAAYLFLLEPSLERREAAKIAAFIDALPGTLKAERITMNILEKNFIISNLHGTIQGPGGADMEIRILEFIGSSLNDKALTASANAPLIKEGQITHMTIKTSSPVGGMDSSAPREMQVERLFFHDVRGNASSLLKEGKSEQALFGFLSGLSFSDLSIYGYTDKAETAQGTVSVSAQNASFTAGANTAERGTLGDMRKLLLPAVLKGEVGTGDDRQAISNGLAEFAQGAGRLVITLQLDQPVPMPRLASGGELPLHAHVESGLGR